MRLCPGRVGGDQEATTTYHFRLRATRIDHVFVSVAALPRISTYCIVERQMDSDHSPNELLLTLPRARSAPSAVGGTPVCCVHAHRTRFSGGAQWAPCLLNLTLAYLNMQRKQQTFLAIDLLPPGVGWQSTLGAAFGAWVTPGQCRCPVSSYSEA